MANSKKKAAETQHSEDADVVMNVYRDSVLPTPILLWRTEGKTVAAWELTEENWEAVADLLGIDTK